MVNMNNDPLSRAMQLLKQALSVSLPDDKHVTEAKTYMRTALLKLETSNKVQLKKQKDIKQEEFTKQWSSVVAKSGTAKMPTVNYTPTGNSAIRTLRELNSMIAEAKKELTDLEKPKDPGPQAPEILED